MVRQGARAHNHPHRLRRGRSRELAHVGRHLHMDHRAFLDVGSPGLGRRRACGLPRMHRQVDPGPVLQRVRILRPLDQVARNVIHTAARQIPVHRRGTPSQGHRGPGGRGAQDPRRPDGGHRLTGGTVHGPNVRDLTVWVVGRTRVDRYPGRDPVCPDVIVPYPAGQGRAVLVLAVSNQPPVALRVRHPRLGLGSRYLPVTA